MRLGLSVCGILVACAAGLSAATIGVGVNGTCEGGNCAGTPLPFNTTETLPFDFNFTLADGDIYLIYGSFTDINNSDGSGSVNLFAFQVNYEGNASGGGPSAADTITVERDASFQSSVTMVDFTTTLAGLFGPTIADSSSASSCFGGTLACLGPVSPPGSFSEFTSVPINNINGSYTDEKTFVSVFGAGSPVGSYIVWGQDMPLSEVPEPASIGLLGLGLGAMITLGARLRRRV